MPASDSRPSRLTTRSGTPLAQFGRGTCVSGVAAVGFPIPRLRVVRSSRPMAGRSSWPGASGVSGRLVPTRPERLAVAADGGL